MSGVDGLKNNAIGTDGWCQERARLSYIVDAQLPLRLARCLRDRGYGLKKAIAIYGWWVMPCGLNCSHLSPTLASRSTASSENVANTQAAPTTAIENLYQIRFTYPFYF